MCEPGNKTAAAEAGGEPYFVALASVAVFHALVQVQAVGLSVLRIRLGSPAAVAVLVTSVVGAFLAWRYLPRRYPEASLGAEWSTVARARAFVKAVILLAVVVYSTLWVSSYFRPDVSWDGNVYHIPTMHFWASKGYIHWIDWPGGCEAFMNGYPKAVEVTAYVMASAFDNSHFVNTANLMFLPLGVLAVAYLSRSIGASPALSATAGATWVLIPINILQSGTTYVDSGYASCAAAFVAAAVYAASHTGDRGELFPWRSALPLGAAAGLAAGAKGTGPLLVAIGCVVLGTVAVFGVVRHGGGRRRKLVAAGAAFGLSAVAIAMAVGGYWYLRNWVITRSPVYPMGLSAGPVEIFPGPNLEEAVGIAANTPPALRGLPGYQKALLSWAQLAFHTDTVWRSWLKSLQDLGGGWGYLWIVGCLPAIAWLIVAKILPRREGWLAAATLVLVVAGAFVVQPMNWQARFAVWIYALGLPCFALAASGLWEKGRRGKRWGRLWVAACLGMMMFEGAFTLSRVVPIALRPRNVLPSLERHYWGRPVCYLLPELGGSVFDEILSGNAPVALGTLAGRTPSGPKNGILGQLALPLGQRRIHHVEGPIDEGVLAVLASRGVKYVILDGNASVAPTIESAGVTVERPAGFLVLTIESPTVR